ncbi:UNVERIFIED_CONTAM: hypothetical protein PYX00_005584 [Menopon gallinae]|uniref:Uncharacterized protein n=1 Tax=Menopon gallinae TaxID=328185 RepID=A0AAW2HSQ7_9NEOP
MDQLFRQGHGVREATRDFHLVRSSAVSCRLPGVTSRIWANTTLLNHPCHGRPRGRLPPDTPTVNPRHRFTTCRK